MNETFHRKYTLEFDVWGPLAKVTEAEMDALVSMLKTKRLLEHAGNVKIVMLTEERL